MPGKTLKLSLEFCWQKSMRDEITDIWMVSIIFPRTRNAQKYAIVSNVAVIHTATNWIHGFNP